MGAFQRLFYHSIRQYPIVSQYLQVIVDKEYWRSPQLCIPSFWGSLFLLAGPLICAGRRPEKKASMSDSFLARVD